MSTDIRTASLTATLPPSLLDDAEAVRLALALDGSLQQVASDTDLARLLPRIDSMGEGPLNLLAWSYQLLRLIGWDLATLPRKRALLKRALRLYAKSGTKRGIRAALAMMGINAEIVEWWQDHRAAFTYRANMEIGVGGLSALGFAGAVQLLAEYAPARAWLTELTTTITSSEAPDSAGDLRVHTFSALGAP